MTDSVTLTRDGAVAAITFDRPATRNALTLADLTAISAALDEAEAMEGLRALVLTGAGDRVFSAGVDLSDVGGDAADWAENPLTALCARLAAFPRPTVARVNGAVVGGAVELSLACDFRAGRPGVKLFVPATRIGIHYEPPGLSRAVAVLGMQPARRIYLAGERMEDQALAAIGYFDEIAETADDAVAVLTARLVAGAPLAVDGMKQTLAEIAAGAPRPEAAAARVRATWASEDMQEGLAAMREKREAVFKGR